MQTGRQTEKKQADKTDWLTRQAGRQRRKTGIQNRKAGREEHRQ